MSGSGHDHEDIAADKDVRLCGPICLSDSFSIDQLRRGIEFNETTCVVCRLCVRIFPYYTMLIVYRVLIYILTHAQFRMDRTEKLVFWSIDPVFHTNDIQYIIGFNITEMLFIVKRVT